MRELFPGYFTPTEQDFTELWHNATFAFDANVLLGLYRLTTESRKVFFDALEKLGNRIFLPNQAALEYLRNRMEAISARSRSHDEVKTDAGKFVRSLEARVQEHSFPKSKEIIEAAKQAENKIAEIVDAALEKEPDLLRSDEVLMKLTEIFEGKTGQPYEASQLADLYKKATERYSKKVPPGYKDDSKKEPDKFGDAIIWFQLLEFARSNKKPVIFVTQDAKEDWWLQHNSETVGPRPELVQEMKQVGGVRFYMYTTKRFLEFAQHIFSLKPEATKKATSEIEEIERKDKKAAASTTDHPWQLTNFDSPQSYNFGEMPSGPLGPTKYYYYDDAIGSGVAGSYLNSLSPFVHYPVNEFSAGDEATQNRYLQLLPINGFVFNSSAGSWKCEVTSTPSPASKDRACYKLKFIRADLTKASRDLVLWLSMASLHNDPDWMYKKVVFRLISNWLASSKGSGELAYFG
jgi:hypothetical protein